MVKVHTLVNLEWDLRDKWEAEVFKVLEVNLGYDQGLGPSKVQEQDLDFHPSKVSLLVVGVMVLNNKVQDQWLLEVSRECDHRCSSSKVNLMVEVGHKLLSKEFDKVFHRIRVGYHQGEGVLTLVEELLLSNNQGWDQNKCKVAEVFHLVQPMDPNLQEELACLKEDHRWQVVGLEVNRVQDKDILNNRWEDLTNKADHHNNNHQAGSWVDRNKWEAHTPWVGPNRWEDHNTWVVPNN